MAFAPSPFPGMDPWLEGVWGDVHHTVISRLSDQIAVGLPDGLVVVIEERFVPDPDAPRTRCEPETAGSIQIRHVGSDRPVVTAVEVVRPTDKFASRGRCDYRRKRRAYSRADANVVEIDLLRGGPTVVGLPDGADRPDVPYRCVVRRGGRAASEVEYYPIGLRDRLPRFGVPLRATDDDVVIDLQPPIDHVYKRGRYDLQIDYARPPDPPLAAADAAWAAGLVAGRSRGNEP